MSLGESLFGEANGFVQPASIDMARVVSPTFTDLFTSRWVHSASTVV